MTEPVSVGPMTERFNLATFTEELIGDLKLLRAGKISVRDARARADLAKQVLRAVHYVVTAQKFLADNAKQIPAAGD
jgi:hypothetical protein